MKRPLSLVLRLCRPLGCAAVLALPCVAHAQTCEEAWEHYNEFKKRNVMEASEYARTVYGAQVRAACGANALPVPPGTDTPRRVIRRPAHPTSPTPVPPSSNKPN